MEGRQARARAAVALDLVGIIGLTAFFVGLTWLRTSEDIGFDPGGAVAGVLSQLAVTAPAALLILAATGLELAAGLVLARMLRRTPFDSAAEALLAAFVAAVLKDTILLGTLAAVGAFRAPLLVGLDLAVVLVALGLPAIARRVRPLMDLPGWRSAIGSVGSVPIAALVAVVWAGPMVLQLASPVVPFIDVLPNYVGPVEHLRTFGWFSPLTATQSPIIGPSRTVLGYDAFVGSLASVTGLPGGAAIAAFIAPQLILVAAGAQRLARALRAGAAVGPWALLAFALSQSFGRLSDARGTVVVVPLVCLGLALAAERLHSAPARPSTETHEPETATATPRADQGDPWRIGRGAVAGLAVGAAILVHPVIGFFAIVTVGIAALARPRELGADGAAAAVVAGLIALPQLATMVGLSLPTPVLGVGLPVAIAIGAGAGRAVSTNPRLRDGLVRLATLLRIPVAVLVVGGVVLAFGIGALETGRLGGALGETATLAYEAAAILLIVIAIGIALDLPGARSPLVLAGLGVGAAAVALTQVLPDDLGLLGSALRFEVPKTVHYWLGSIAAAGAGAALAGLWSSRQLRWPVAARAGVAAVFVALAALPLRPAPIDAYHLGEHRWSESFAIDLRFAARGFWQGFPDTRTVVDAPRQDLLDALRGEIDAGRLEHDTPVLHVAKSFQQWVATPLGVFDGVTETFVSLDPEVSHQTVGGRLYGLDRLGGFLGSGEFGYVVLEPAGLPDGLADAIGTAGYRSIFGNGQGQVFRLGS